MEEIGLVAHNPDAELIAATTEPIARSPAAERMRRHRRRRRNGLRCLSIELSQSEIDCLSRAGYLRPDARHDLYAIGKALSLLHRELGPIL